MQDLNDKSTGTSLTAVEWNEIPSEIQNVIEKTGQALSPSDLDQLGKGVATYAAGSDFYTDGGAANAYVLSVIGTKKAPATYFDGMRVRFKPTNTNTGASTVNVAGLGVKNIKSHDGTNPAANDILVGEFINIVYNNSAGYFTLEPMFFANHLEIGGGANTYPLNVYKNDSSFCAAHFTNLTTGNTGSDGFTVGINSSEQAQLWNYENTDMRFGVSSTLAVQINASGNVNIGGTHDTNNLMVHQADSAANVVHFTNITTGVTAADGFIVGLSASEQAQLWNFENTQMVLATNNLARLRIENDGGVFTDGATGGSKGVDTINASGYYVDGALIASGTAPAGFLGAAIPVLDLDYASYSNIFDIDAVIGGTFETIGPTGSGATNIWTPMDNLPTTAKFVIIKIINEISGSTNGSGYNSKVFVAKAGITPVANDVSLASVAQLINRTGVSQNDGCITFSIVPLDSSLRFEMSHTTLGTTPTANVRMTLVGYL